MFSGVYTALVTPFDRKGELDREKLKELVDFQIGEGISGLVPVGTTGESPTLSIKENIEVIDLVVKGSAGRKKVIAGTGSNCTSEALEMTKAAKDIGADASLQVAPYYNKPTQEGLYRHFMTIADEVDLPLVVYNIQGRSGVNIETDTLMRLAKHPNIVAVKEASGNLGQMMDVISRKPEDFALLSGDDNIAMPVTLMGGNGVISVASNLIPAQMEAMIGAALKGDVETARDMHYKLLPLFKAMFLETNPLPVKTAMAIMGKVEEIFRLPLCPSSGETKEKLKEVLKGQNLI
ncbi:4-hydroxy-tetrahydrodipicolinate synthase [Spirochaeta isovalerica]|uniref:4-hydroxy-tetrahydrodipicolinate synthase n=1 Tax=Spirochaeta isovalerica TaxID=150 RepID=A0A841R5Z7_9SPIO|nr:4-hydroxy-tetrahydrodipicolinate synthase [Spirochaeta isovalerica]MBB6480624.1 4-hydroxy-tetrahydrodipicolinate synthase [Spirochaeta isovalerica]